MLDDPRLPERLLRGAGRQENNVLVIPTRGRPQNLQRLVHACAETGCSTPAWVRLDSDDSFLSQYQDITFPAGWDVVVGQRLPLSAVYNEILTKKPDTPYWFFIADDVVPKTDGWDTKLIQKALPDGMAVPAGGHDLEGAPHFVLSGDLVRSVGWLALPGLSRIYIDQVWIDIANERGVLRRIPDVILEHRHFSNRLSLFDETYRKPHKKRDREIYNRWRRNASSPKDRCHA